jgi:hypothetical protein
MENRNNCMICTENLVYYNDYRKSECFICKSTFDANAECRKGHFVCDECHSASANQFIKTYCVNSKGEDPLSMADIIMKHPSVKMHGPEHHFLVPAVLLTAYYNKTGNNGIIKEKLEAAEKRAKNVLGGFCGFYGNCGAAVGTGIFISLITETTPLSGETWKLSNLATATSLLQIAEHGGPRCCKRDTFIALKEAVAFIKNKFRIEIEDYGKINCNFSSMNKECRKRECEFYNES